VPGGANVYPHVIHGSLQRVYTMQPDVQPVLQPTRRNTVNVHSIKRVTSSTVHTAAFLRRSGVINVLAGPLKRLLAGIFAQFIQPVIQPVVRRLVKCKHRVRLARVCPFKRRLDRFDRFDRAHRCAKHTRRSGVVCS